MTKQFIKILYPGTMFPEETIIEIKSRNELPNIPKGCFAYEFFDRTETEIDGEKLYGSPKNKSGRFYFGKAYTLSEVKENFPDHDILISNMEANKYETIVKTRRGNFQPLGENDVIVSEV